jgi:prolyl-tRNA synthetase
LSPSATKVLKEKINALIMDATKLHLEGLTVGKNDNFSEWYRQLVTKAKFIEYYDISGCYVMLPNSYGVWEIVVTHLDREFKKRGVKNAYFPLLISEKNLSREETHIADFTPEVAWVTRSGQSVLDEPIAIRPTSECAIYSVLPNMIRTHRDLPMKLNQWCNVVRWEFKAPTPFIRSREFLWNEGHTAFSTQEEALNEVDDIIHVYQNAYRSVLCVPTIVGIKTEKEKFAGAELTYTIEGFIPNVGKGIQAATAHYLGQNFSKMFNIKYQDGNQENKYVHQNSWGFTTRSIGVTIMTHGDDKGMVYPPTIAPIQIVIIPIWNKNSKENVMVFCQNIYNQLSSLYRVHFDDTDDKPGAKFNHWELNGVPIRIEIGPKDIAKGVITCCRRDDGTKTEIPINDLDGTINALIESISDDMYVRASKKFDECVCRPDNRANMVAALEDKKMCLIPWCGCTTCEEQIKEDTTAKSLCCPIESQYILNIGKDDKCIYCNLPATLTCLFGKSY